MDEQLFIADRATLDGAIDLIARFGEEAGDEAAQRADTSRDRGNIVHFCRWRQVERLILVLGSGIPVGSLH